MASVDVSVTDGVSADPAPIEADALAVLDSLDLGHAELSVLLCDDATIRPLNRDWRHKDKATDVLSFSQLDGDPAPGGPDDPPLLLGDVVISVETAQRQAEARGHSLAHELRVLLIHGICHLIGHDHEDDGEAEVMEMLERSLLEALKAEAG